MSPPALDSAGGPAAARVLLAAIFAACSAVGYGAVTGHQQPGCVDARVVSVRADNDSRVHASAVLSELAQPQATGVRAPVVLEVTTGRPDWLADQQVSYLASPGAYLVRVAPSRIVVVAHGAWDVAPALTSLQRRIKAARGCIAPGTQRAKPLHAVRGLHVVLRLMSADAIRGIMVAARRERFNLIVLQLSDGAALKSLARVARPNALGIDELKALARFAEANGLQVVPEVTLLTHQERNLSDGELKPFNRDTYDPRAASTFKWVYALLDEVIDVFHPDAIHIGHDEVYGWHSSQRDELREIGQKPLPSDLYLDDVKRISSYLESKGITPWMWGDMLLSPGQFPAMDKSMMHGQLPGYPRLVDDLPKNLVIVDWHYYGTQPDFPSSKYLSDKGFRVVGATWKNPATTKAFSRYLAKHVKRGEGMLATTWFHVQRREWDTVENIIKISGEAFWGEQ